MIRHLSYNFCVHCYYSVLVLDNVIIALKSTIGKNIILGDLVHVYSKQIPDSKKNLYEIVKIDLEKGVSVRGIEDLEKIYILNTNEIIVF